MTNIEKASLFAAGTIATAGITALPQEKAEAQIDCNRPIRHEQYFPNSHRHHRKIRDFRQQSGEYHQPPNDYRQPTNHYPYPDQRIQQQQPQYEYDNNKSYEYIRVQDRNGNIIHFRRR